MQKREAPNALQGHTHSTMTAKQDTETQSINVMSKILLLLSLLFVLHPYEQGPEHNTEKNAEGSTGDNAGHNVQEYTELSLERSSGTMQEQSYSSPWAESICPARVYFNQSIMEGSDADLTMQSLFLEVELNYGHSQWRQFLKVRNRFSNVR
jgi:hypothetical protein